MNEKISALIRLQELDKALDDLDQAVRRLTPEREGLKAQWADRAARWEASKKSLVDAQVRKKNLELEIDAKEQAIRKHGGELNSVKSNDAYKALLSEIDAAKAQKVALEDQVLVLMETIEALQKQAKDNEASAQRDRGEIEAKIAAVDAEEAALRAKADAGRAEREAFAAGVPAASRARYDAVARGRAGFLAVVPVNGMTCGGCRTLLTADTVNQAMKGKDIVSCDSCSRLLYIIPKPVTP